MLEKIRNFKFKSIAAIMSVLSISAFTSIFAFSYGGAASTNGDVDIANIIGAFLGYVQDVFIVIGILLIAWGIGQLALAFKDDNPESKSRAMMMIATAAILVGIGSLMGSIISTLGFGITIGDGFI